MLQRVVFFLKKEGAEKEIEKLLAELTTNRIEVFTTNVCKNMDTKNICDNVNTLIVKDIDNTTNVCKTLFITDCIDCLSLLQERHLPTIVYLHEDNRGEDFSQAAYAIEQIEEIELESLELAYQRLTGQPWTILTTKRCKIRESTTNDIDAFYEIYREPSITYYMEDLFEDRAEEIAYMKDYIQKVYGFYGYGMWTVLEKENEHIIGRAGISWREGYDVPELGFVIALPYQGKGYAYEVCHAILEYGQKELGFTRYQVLIMEGNVKSEQLCRKLGFMDDSVVLMDGRKYKRMLLQMKEDKIIG